MSPFENMAEKDGGVPMHLKVREDTGPFPLHCFTCILFYLRNFAVCMAPLEVLLAPLIVLADRTKHLLPRPNEVLMQL